MHATVSENNKLDEESDEAEELSMGVFGPARGTSMRLTCLFIYIILIFVIFVDSLHYSFV